MSITISPISISRGSNLYDRSARDLQGKLCKFYQTDDNGNELDVEGVFADSGSKERDKGKITFYLPGDKKISYIDTSQGRVKITPLDNAQILDEKLLNGELKLGESIQIGSSEKPATPDEIRTKLAQISVSNTYRVRAILGQNVRICCGKLSFVGSKEIVFTSSSGYKNKLPLKDITQINIRRIAKVKID